MPGIAFGVEGNVGFAFSKLEENIDQGLHVLQKAFHCFV